MNRVAAWCLGGFLALSAASPAFAAKKTSPLYERLGQRKGIATVVDKFVTRCATDDRIKGFFAKTAKSKKRLAAFKRKLTDQICQEVGGPCKYRGLSMKKAHRRMGVKEEHFDALVQNLSATFDEVGVTQEDQQAIFAKLGPMKKDIVGSGRDTASEKKGKRRH